MHEWNTGDSKKLCKECSWTDNYTGGTIFLTPELREVIRLLCEQKPKEWQMLLIGHEDKHNVYCTDYYVPKQEVSSATVKNLDNISKKFIDENKIICGIHSHSEMGTHFSTTDDEYTNMSLIENNIVTNNAGDFKAIRRFTLPCGMVKFLEARVVVQYDKPVVTEVRGIENITETSYITPTYPLGRSWYDDADTPYAEGSWYMKGRNNNGKKKKKKGGKKTLLHVGV